MAMLATAMLWLLEKIGIPWSHHRTITPPQQHTTLAMGMIEGFIANATRAVTANAANAVITHLDTTPWWTSTAFIVINVFIWLKAWFPLVSRTVYREASSYDQMIKVIKLVKTHVANKRAISCFGHELIYNMSCPMLTVSFTYVAWTKIDTSMDGTCNVTFTVYRIAGFAPLVPHERMMPHERPMPHERRAEETEDAMIQVLRPTSNSMSDVSSLTVFNEVCTLSSASGDDEAFANCNNVAEEMMTLIPPPKKDHNGDNVGFAARVFVLHGPPGTGKSTCARVLTRLLGGRLYPSYVPTQPGLAINYVLSRYRDDEVPLVVVIEEVDVLLQAIVDQTVKDSDEMMPDAKNKSSWNSLLDGIRFKTNVVLVMTTNKTPDELNKEVCRGDTSYLRTNRVDRFFEVKRAEPTCRCNVTVTDSNTDSDTCSSDSESRYL